MTTKRQPPTDLFASTTAVPPSQPGGCRWWKHPDRPAWEHGPPMIGARLCALAPSHQADHVEGPAIVAPAPKVEVSPSMRHDAAAAGAPVEVRSAPVEAKPENGQSSPVSDPAGQADAPPVEPEPVEPEPGSPPQEAKPQEAPPQRDATGRKLEPVPFYPRDTGEMFRYAGFLARSSLVPYALRGKPDDILLVLLKGHDLGLKPQQAIATIHIIDGKAEVGALLMVSLILKSGLCESWRLMHSDVTRAVYQTQRRGDREPTIFEYTIQEADQMGLLDKGRDERAKANNQWKKQPRTMLRRRAQSNLAREVYPDVVLGLYDHDELAELRSDTAAIGLTPVQVADSIEVESRAADPAPRALPAPLSSSVMSAVLAGVDARELVPPARAPRDPLKERLAARSMLGPDPLASGQSVLSGPPPGDLKP